LPGRAGLETSEYGILKIVITGFNTDIEHEGVVYHVQTEDKGLDSPLILSLVYAGGAILASKRSRYEDLIASGFDEEVLAKRLKRQHRLICAAINAGRLEELKRMAGRPEEELSQPALTQPTGPAPRGRKTAKASEPVSAVADAALRDEDPTIEERAPADTAPLGPPVFSEESAADQAEREAFVLTGTQSPLGEALNKETRLVLTMLDENEFRAGETFTIRVLVEDGSKDQQKPLMGVSVSVKILGTTFRPQIYSVRTERDGVAAISTTMPSFTSGRAAVLVRAVANGETSELRRVIYPAQ
jgi:hypothetical protein